MLLRLGSRLVPVTPTLSQRYVRSCVLLEPRPALTWQNFKIPPPPPKEENKDEKK
jgi:hypothetical protein